MTACGASIGSVEPPSLAALPEELGEPCARPATLPDRELTQVETEAYWISDREKLIRCGFKLEHVLAFYADRDKRITSE